VERLWTPWRRAFVEGDDNKTAGCFLCEAPAAHDDRANLILYRGDQVFVLLNKYPYNSGHLMIAPYIHTGDLAALDPAIAAELMHVAQRALDVLQRGYTPDAFNAGMNLGKAAGAGVPDHLHLHVVPRWNGDTNFMPIIADTKVMPETVDQTYDRLERLLRA
jgi:ATP adenylyltransferase